jgi:hypothetical protein
MTMLHAEIVAALAALTPEASNGTLRTLATPVIPQPLERVVTEGLMRCGGFS